MKMLPPVCGLVAASMLLGFSPLAAQMSPAPSPVPGPRTFQTSVTPIARNLGRHAEFLQRSKRAVGLLFLGDSIMDFWPGRGPASWAKFSPYQAANFGVSGERTEDVLWRITNGELAGIFPRVTIVLIGTNNLGQQGERPEWTAAGVRKIVETIHTRLPKTKVLLLGIFPRDTPNSPIRHAITTANNIISKLDDGNTTRYLDITKSLVDPAGNIPKDVMEDGLHPTAKGYDIWYDAMHPLLDEMLRTPFSS